MVPVNLPPHRLDGLPPGELALELWAILEAVDFEYERFTDALGLNPLSPDVEAFHQQVHSSYPEAWRQEGDEFWMRLRPLVEHWRKVLSKPEVH
jgi:hypothetical protein